VSFFLYVTQLWVKYAVCDMPCITWHIYRGRAKILVQGRLSPLALPYLHLWCRELLPRRFRRTHARRYCVCRVETISGIIRDDALPSPERGSWGKRGSLRRLGDDGQCEWNVIIRVYALSVVYAEIAVAHGSTGEKTTNDEGLPEMNIWTVFLFIFSIRPRKACGAS
jgi:hypothetical protein